MQAKRRRYRREVEQIDAKRLVFVDETGINTAMTPTSARLGAAGQAGHRLGPHQVGFRRR